MRLIFDCKVLQISSGGSALQNPGWVAKSRKSKGLYFIQGRCEWSQKRELDILLLGR
jgi:hypothetical protein